MASSAGFAQLLKDVAKPALTSGSLATGLSLLSGANPLQALASGAIDVAADVATLGALRKLSPKSYRKRTVIDKETGKESIVQDTHPLETPLNVAASIGAGYVANPFIYGTGQQLQIAQELKQRADVNDLMTQQIAPGTQFQTAGLEFLQNYRRQMPQLPNYYSAEDLALLAAHGAA